MTKRHGRRRPYTAMGIGRVPCSRCQEPASQQWNVCSDDGLFRPICIACDVALNELVLRWMRFSEDEVAERMNRYRQRFVKS